MSFNGILSGFVEGYKTGSGIKLAKEKEKLAEDQNEWRKDYANRSMDLSEDRQRFAMDKATAGDREREAAYESGSGGLSPGGIDTKKAKDYTDYLVNKGVPLPAATGMVANVFQESGGNPSAVGDNGNSVGLFQHNGPRREALTNWAKVNGKNPLDPYVQMDFALGELSQSPDVKARLWGAKDPREAAKIFSNDFERPGKPMLGNRLSYADQISKLYSPSSAGGAVPTQVAQAQPDLQDADYDDDSGAVGYAGGGSVDKEEDLKVRNQQVGLLGDAGEDVPPDLKQGVGSAVGAGLKFIQNEFGLSGGAVQSGARPDGARRMAMGEGAATPVEYHQVMEKVDPNNKFDLDTRHAMGLKAVYDFYNEKGDGAKAAAAAGSLLQFFKAKAAEYGDQTETALKQGNLPAAFSSARAAFDHMPDGTKIDFKQGSNGGYRYVRTDASTGQVVDEGPITPQQLMQVAIGVKNGTAYWAHMAATAGNATTPDAPQAKKSPAVSEQYSGIGPKAREAGIAAERDVPVEGDVTRDSLMAQQPSPAPAGPIPSPSVPAPPAGAPPAPAGPVPSPEVPAPAAPEAVAAGATPEGPAMDAVPDKASAVKTKSKAGKTMTVKQAEDLGKALEPEVNNLFSKIPDNKGLSKDVRGGIKNIAASIAQLNGMDAQSAVTATRSLINPDLSGKEAKFSDIRKLPDGNVMVKLSSGAVVKLTSSAASQVDMVRQSLLTHGKSIKEREAKRNAAINTLGKGASDVASGVKGTVGDMASGLFKSLTSGTSNTEDQSFIPSFSDGGPVAKPEPPAKSKNKPADTKWLSRLPPQARKKFQQLVDQVESQRKQLESVANKGRSGDSELAHVNPREAAMLRAHGGSGAINPRTGLREYADDSGQGENARGASGSNAGSSGGGYSGSGSTGGGGLGGNLSSGPNSAQAQQAGTNGSWGSGYSGTAGGVTTLNPQGYVGGYGVNTARAPSPSQRAIRAQQLAQSGLSNAGSWGSGYAGQSESEVGFATNPAHMAGGSDYNGPTGGAGAGFSGYIGGGGTGNSGMGGSVYAGPNGQWSGVDKYGRAVSGAVNSPAVNYGAPSTGAPGQTMNYSPDVVNQVKRNLASMPPAQRQRYVQQLAQAGFDVRQIGPYSFSRANVSDPQAGQWGWGPNGQPVDFAPTQPGVFNWQQQPQIPGSVGIPANWTPSTPAVAAAPGAYDFSHAMVSDPQAGQWGWGPNGTAVDVGAPSTTFDPNFNFDPRGAMYDSSGMIAQENTTPGYATYQGQGYTPTNFGGGYNYASGSQRGPR